jgi:nucleoside-diphosphate-sugar epimerase
MNILVTGGAGYIGSELVGHLLKYYNVHVVDTLMYESTSLLRYTNNPKFHFYKEDVRNKTFMSKILKNMDAIIPLAAIVGFPLCEKNKLESEQVNYEINQWIADNKSPQQRIIYPCTNSGYGTTDGTDYCTEESPLNPITHYGVTKVKAEDAYKNVENHVTFRLATVFGPSSRMRTDLLVNNFVLRALKDNLIVLYQHSFMRNYLHIQDVCKAFMFVLSNWERCKNETYNVGNDKINMNKLQLAQKIKEYTPLEIIKAEFTEDPDLRNYIVSSKKFYDKGFCASYNLDDGIKQLITAYDIIDEPWYANY